ncbi:pro-resilin-like [Palaemon carinicauda]|uniref:pro-resilin-like n=1 Tax=Palaemon carinicauda TaxID=392227 RepID=UPI0035B5A657
MIAKICLLLSLVAAVFGGPSQPQYGYAPPPSHEEPAKYDFNYAVKDDYSGNDFGHQEICLLLSLVAAVFGGPSQPQYGYAPPPSHEEPAKYDFNYAVKDDYSGNDFGHQEARDGYDTQGSYYVLLPDGRLQKVSYNVNGDSGFVAEVTYEGEPQYNPAPSYA